MLRLRRHNIRLHPVNRRSIGDDGWDGAEGVELERRSVGVDPLCGPLQRDLIVDCFNDARLRARTRPRGSRPVRLAIR